MKPDSKEWVSETKVVVPNAAKVHEEQLRQKALAEKEKEMAALKKDMVRFTRKLSFLIYLFLFFSLCTIFSA